MIRKASGSIFIALAALSFFGASGRVTAGPAADGRALPLTFGPDDGWYDMQRHNGRWEWTATALDGYPVHITLIPAARMPAPMLLLLPDFPMASNDIRVLQIATQLHEAAHVAVVTGRGHRDSSPGALRGVVSASDLTRNLEMAQRISLDYWAAIASIEETAEPLHLGISRSCIVAGDFHSNLVLIQSLPGIQCIAALSPNAEFYRSELAQLGAREVAAPVLLMEGRSFFFRLTAVAAQLQRAASLRVDSPQKGILLLQNEAARNELLRFVAAPENYQAPLSPNPGPG
ncbi:MAG: hypothetical protein K1X75_14750 [Leptospirales bacterium]|nr:hypothetical protein [Leptospirales bacterium]